MEVSSEAKKGYEKDTFFKITSYIAFIGIFQEYGRVLCDLLLILEIGLLDSDFSKSSQEDTGYLFSIFTLGI